MNYYCRSLMLMSVITTGLLGGCQWGKTQLGIAQIALPEGHVLYVKREARGLTHDQLAISPNGDVCTPQNSATGYIFDGVGAGELPLFCSASGNVLTIYHTTAIEEPPHPAAGVRITLQVLNPSQYAALRDKYAERGIKRLIVNLDPGVKCR